MARIKNVSFKTDRDARNNESAQSFRKTILDYGEQKEWCPTYKAAAVGNIEMLPFSDQ